MTTLEAGAELTSPCLLEQPHEVLSGETVPSDNVKVVAWRNGDGRTFVRDVRLRAEGTEGFSAYVPGLPGVVSEGDTEDATLANIKEALAAALEGYLEGGKDIPWEPSYAPLTPGEIQHRVVVHV